MAVKVFSADYLDALSAEAGKSPRRRQHRNVHESFAEACQRTFIAIEPASYVQPHRHSLIPRDELMIAIPGLLALVLFDDEGTVTGMIRFGAEESATARGAAAAVETVAGQWHTVLALEPGSVMAEIKAGPYHPAQPKEAAPWAPAEGTAEGARYLDRLQTLAAQKT